MSVLPVLLDVRNRARRPLLLAREERAIPVRVEHDLESVDAAISHMRPLRDVDGKLLGQLGAP